jgi:hypothetical protein
MAIDTSRGMDVYFEDFHGDLIPDELATSSDSGTVTTNVGLSGGQAGAASILRLDNSNNGDNEMAEVDLGALLYRVQDGRMYMEARVSIERTTAAATVGFNDDTLEGSNTLPAELSTTTFTSNAGTWIGFLFDSDATTDNWHVFWVDDDNDSTVAIATLQTDIAVASDTWYTLKVDLQDAGSGNQAICNFSVDDENGNSWEYRATSTIDRDVAMVPHIAVENRTTTGAFIDIDYIEAGKSRS